MIEILKASAGSGKTWNLANRYIRLLLTNYATDRNAYRHILAVTFTNKATEEMKSRIIGELYLLSSKPEDSDYFDEFVPAIMTSSAALAEAASNILCSILHDYSAFSVSTIDKFFQQTLRAFSREIGRFASYQVELDRNALICEGIDMVLDSLSAKDQSKIDWILQEAMRKLSEGKKFRLESSLYSVGQSLLSEERRDVLEAAGLKNVKPDLNALRSRLAEYKSGFENTLAETSKQIIAECSKCGIDPASTHTHFLSKILGKCTLPIEAPKEAALLRLSDPKEWFAKANARMCNRVSEELKRLCAQLIILFTRDIKYYKTADAILKQIYGLGLDEDISNNFQKLLKDKNVLSIDDSASLLRDIIDGTDAPFIYEKLGVRYEHFLLDEFQDTSSIQWDNFKPLLDNSMAGGFYNLVVGDVKQSIYRWRGSDWNLLGERLGQELDPSQQETKSLEYNFRSMEEIVKFNNAFFKYAAETLQNILNPGGDNLTSLYQDLEQKVASKNLGGGYVSVDFCDKEEEPAYVVDQVYEALDHGFRYRDIAILVRGNAEGGQLALILMGAGIPVITDDSLKLKSSVTVNRLLSMLSNIDNPGDVLVSYLAKELGVGTPEDYHSLPDLCEQLLRMLRDADRETFEAETVYIQCFMDKVQDFVMQNNGSLHAFVEFMNEDNSVVSSPADGDSVRIMTIHKSKGLDFPYVILPYLERIKLFKYDYHWCRPLVSGTPIEFADGIYNVCLSYSTTENTLFDSSYRQEYERQHVDNMNVAYVAFTRASKVLRIIGDKAAKKDTFAAILHNYLNNNDNVVYGEIPEYVPKNASPSSGVISLSYPSFPMGDRLGFSCDSSDFFSSDGEAGLDASARRRGIILHGILSSIVSSSDLGAAVSAAVADGRLESSDASAVLDFLSKRIASVSCRGWFPDKREDVWNECSLMDADGYILRPDRVVLMPDGTLAVIDYKFGTPKPSYVRQIGRYAAAYRALGYENVKSYLWYVDDNNVVETENFLTL